MTAELAPSTNQTLFVLADDLQTYTQTLELLEAQLAEPLPDDERGDIEKARAEVLASIQGIGAALANKTDAVAAVLRRLGSEQLNLGEERNRLKKREDAVERAEKWLRDYVVSVMKQNGVKQLKTTNNTLFIRGSEAVEITDVERVPELYQNAEVKLPLWLWNAMVKAIEVEGVRRDAETVRVKAEPSVSTIRKAIKSGVEVPGADLRFRDHLVMR